MDVFGGTLFSLPHPDSYCSLYEAGLELLKTFLYPSEGGSPKTIGGRRGLFVWLTTVSIMVHDTCLLQMGLPSSAKTQALGRQTQLPGEREGVQPGRQHGVSSPASQLPSSPVPQLPNPTSPPAPQLPSPQRPSPPAPQMAPGRQRLGQRRQSGQ